MPNSTQAGDLVAISKAKGWDPSKIWDQEKGAYVEDISSWDHERGPFDRGLGQVPDSQPLPATDTGHDAQGTDPSGGPAMEQKLTFNAPDLGREARVSGSPKRTLTDPTQGMPGA